MSKQKEIAAFLAAKAPLHWQESYDNAGFLVGEPDASIEKILVALDVTLPVVEEAAKNGATLIVAHHPIIFQPVRRLTDADGTSRVIRALIQNGIGAICMHTNLDAAPGGVNDLLAEALGLQKTDVLLPAGTTADGIPYGIGRVGFLQKPMTLSAYTEQVKQALHTKGLRFCDGGQQVFRVAVGGGSCGSLLSEVIALGCDTFVTGDVKYDVFLEAVAMGVNLIDAGHFPTENLICTQLVHWLQEAFPQVEVMLSSSHRDVVQFV
ncbi:MAG: Nif3-like dinuclear metal center hexameric protein [Oscillospiraceae bacterium]|nr:Nif3-like dinuclear metal center hexameric protein [Oscillospiraceae bacterium]